VSYPTVAGRAVEGTPYREAQVDLTPKFASSYYLFSLSGGNTLTNVYTNGTLTAPFTTTGTVTADAYGRFPAIYLDPSVIYRVRLFNSAGVQQWQQDPYSSQLSTVGTSSLSAYGFQIAPTGEFTLDAPNTGGTGVTLTINAGLLGAAALEVIGTLPGNSAIIINSSATTGAQTATFQANNLPGTPPVFYNVTATAAPAGGAYVGGNLTVAFTGTTGTYTIKLSTGQDIFGAMFTNGAVAFTTPSTVISGTPNASLNVQSPVTPAGWLPVTCDGVQYYTPIWHGNNFTPYAPNPTAVGEIINASSVTFTGTGLTTVVGGTATPGNWFSPVVAGIGAGYYIKITKTGGLSGVQFSAANGSYANITSGGLTITSNAQATITGTYTLSSSISGSPIVATGTITLSGNNGVQQPTYNGATPLVLAGNGTATLNGGTSSNWYAPTTTNVGSGYYLLINQTGGTSGYSFSAATGTPANITNGGLTVGISGSGATSYNVTGTYIISSDSAGVNVLGSGTVTLTGGFTPLQRLYTAAGSGTETIPAGATTCTIEIYSGVSGGGGGAGAPYSYGGGGGAGPGYSRSVYTVTGHSGQTMAYTVGAAGGGGNGTSGGAGIAGTAGGSASVASSTFTMTTMTATAGGAGAGGTTSAGGAGGAAGAASGGNSVNQAGGAGGAGTHGGGGTNGAAGTYYGTPLYSGTPSAAGSNIGGNGEGSDGTSGSAGIVSFYYT